MVKVRLINDQPHERQALKTAFARIRALLGGDTLPRLGLEVLHRRFLDWFDGTKKLTIRCQDSGDRSALAYFKNRKGGEIEISRSAFSLGEGRIAATLFREMVRACGGSTLDAEALQHHCFPGVGAVPSAEAFQRFGMRQQSDGLRVGVFVLWDPGTGELFVRKGVGKDVRRGVRLRPVFKTGSQQVRGDPAAAEPDGGPVVAGPVKARTVSPERLPAVGHEVAPAADIVEEAAVESQEGVAAESQESAAAESQEGVAAENQASAAAESQDSAAAESQESAAAESQESVAAESQESVAAESQASAAAESQESAAAESQESVAAESQPSAGAKHETAAGAGAEEVAAIQPRVASASERSGVGFSPDWFGTSVPVTALLAGLHLPPEARDLLQEFMALGQRTPAEWSQTLAQMTAFLLERSLALRSEEDPMPPAPHVSQSSPERSASDDRPTGSHPCQAG